MSKKCSQCRRTLSEFSFHKAKTNPDGLYSICKECRGGVIPREPDPEGFIRCKDCDKYKRPYEYYSASGNVQRRTCIECCENKWAKSYKRKTTTHPNQKQSLFGFLSASARRLLSRDNKESRAKDREADKRYRLSEKGKAKRMEWQRNHPDTFRANNSRRRARIANADEGFTKQEWEDTLLFFGNCCVYCGETKNISIDHWIPLAKGGKHVFGNIVPACEPCNYKKQAQVPQRFCDRTTYERIMGALTRLKYEYRDRDVDVSEMGNNP